MVTSVAFMIMRDVQDSSYLQLEGKLRVNSQLLSTRKLHVQYTYIQGILKANKWQAILFKQIRSGDY